jgi:hypothetical protein
MREYHPSYVPGHVDTAFCQRTSIIHGRLYSEAVSLSRKNTWTHVTVIFVFAPWPLSFPSGFVARLRYRFSSRPLTVSLLEFHPINIHASSSTVHHPAWRLSWLAFHTDGFRVWDHLDPRIFTRLFPLFSGSQFIIQIPATWRGKLFIKRILRSCDRASWEIYL